MAELIAGQVFLKIGADTSNVGNVFFPKYIVKQEVSTGNRTVSIAKTSGDFTTQTTQAGVLFDFIVIEPLVTGWGLSPTKQHLSINSVVGAVPANLRGFVIRYDGDTTVPTSIALAAAYTFKTGTPTLAGNVYSAISTPNVVSVNVTLTDVGSNLSFAELLFGTTVVDTVSISPTAGSVTLSAKLTTAGTVIATTRVKDNAGNVSVASTAVTLTSV